MLLPVPQHLNSPNSQTIEYAKVLMGKPSITPLDAGCQDWLAQKLVALGFSVHRFICNGVSNLVATLGQGERAIAFAGHTDVVPPGDMSAWLSDPFSPAIREDKLFGRGAADMKTGLAAMLAATESHIQTGKPINQRFMWLITSDEEGEAEHGSKAIAAWLKQQEVTLDMCIVGEPTSKNRTGDNIKIGRRGAISARLKVKGKQGHVAYPQYAQNAIHAMQALMAALLSIEWDSGSEDFPGTGLQITYVDSGQHTDNLVPAVCELCFNIRYSHQYSEASLIEFIQQRLSAAQCECEYQLSWERGCEPYYTVKKDNTCLIGCIEQAIFANTGTFPLLSTSGGTSDGRFFASHNTQVVEVGVPNQSIHQVNEHVHLSDLVTLQDIYSDLLAELLA